MGAKATYLAILLVSLFAIAHAEAEESGDPLAGAEVFKQCTKCHSIGRDISPTNPGPVLNGLIGRRAGTYPDFSYSPQNRNARLTWDTPTLARYLKAPKSMIPGTKMLFNGLATPKEIADVIAYMAQFNDEGNIKK